ncbi:MAG: ATP-binding cassette domain-containing protein [Gammaproteobacteria bacterium]|nr:ATP-binding cassette domain-containing protein [Gammaproteobacteria bacterium]
MISLQQLSMSFGEKLLFFEVDLYLSAQKHYAVVGANGTGKSTLFKLMNGEETPISGNISIPKEVSIGWLKQDQFRYENTCITDIVLQGKPELWRALEEKEKLLASEDWTDALVNKLSRLEDTIAHLNGYAAYAMAEKLLLGLGIESQYHQKPLNALSGGYKLRVLLAQTLFQEPDLLLLDEPTNHLDLISINWLEKYLNNEFKGLVLVISHDVRFINSLADYILDIDYGEINQYSGQYDKFLAEKKLIEEQKLQAKKSVEQKIAAMQVFVDRFKSKASKAKQAQSRIKMIEKLEIPDIKHSSRAYPSFNFKPKRASGKMVLQVKGLGKCYKDKKLFDRLDFNIARGEKIAIVGENGVGKSTLIKIIQHLIVQDQGKYDWGYETHISYFSQDHHELLNESMRVLDWLTQQVRDTNEQQVRKTLGQLLFPKDDVEKDILALSGGEAARLLLAKIMLEHANVLILDEPTNHLDIEAKIALADALRQFSGTVILVSHDRDFMAHIVNRVFSLSHAKGLHDFRGSFVDFEKTYMQD